MLEGITVAAKDGDIGKVADFYFHDDTWTIRYLVVNTGHWLSRRKVLIMPSVLGEPDWDAFTFPVALTRSQVEKSPEIDTDKPVSRQQEADLHSHYAWPAYWMAPGPACWLPSLPVSPIAGAPEVPGTAIPEKADPRLRSVREVIGYRIHASDGEMGHLEDFIADDAVWVIRYMVVHTGKWFQAKQTLISPHWLGKIRHREKTMEVTLTQENILHCPQFNAGDLVNREYEERLYDYYGRPAYWKQRNQTAHPITYGV